MKCPKCKYITFDYLDTCPRCGKDMSAEKAKLSIFSIKPDPPSLLGSLTGDLNDSSVELRVPESIKKGAEDMKLKGEEVYDDGSELNINIDEESLSASNESAELELGDLGSLDDGKALEIGEESLSESGESAELDLGDLSSSDDEKDLDLDYISDAITPETEKVAVEEEELRLETGSDTGVDQRGVRKADSKKHSEEGALDLGDLELKLDFDEDEDSKQ